MGRENSGARKTRRERVLRVLARATSFLPLLHCAPATYRLYSVRSLLAPGGSRVFDARGVATSTKGITSWNFLPIFSTNFILESQPDIAEKRGKWEKDFF